MSLRPYASAILGDVMVPARDGVRMATDIHLPADTTGQAMKGPFPVILERTPYGKRVPSRAEIDVGMVAPMNRAEVANYFTKRGYAVVYQDCRGRFGSEGTFTKYLSEAEDGFDTCAWIVRQGWCDGRIGTMGLSYAAHTQMALACLGAPGLVTMILDSGGFSNAYRSGIRQGGAFELKQATWAFKQAKESPEAKADPKIRAALEAEDIRLWFTRMPWKESFSPIRHVPDYEAYLFEQWRHGNFGPYWKKAGLWAQGFYKRIPDIPVMLMSSWCDAYIRATFENYAGLTAKGRRAPVHVVMGPWTHGDRTKRRFGDVDFGPDAPFDGAIAEHWRAARLAWFERHLKGAKAATPRSAGHDAGGEEPGSAASKSDEPRAAEKICASGVTYFLPGGGSGRRKDDGSLDHGGAWMRTATWPPKGAKAKTFYLHAGGALSPLKPARAVPPLAYDHDPSNPVPTLGGALTSGEPVFVGGYFDQVENRRFLGCAADGLPLAARPDVLVFQTEQLPRDMHLAGPIRVELHVSSDAPDTDFTAKLLDVHPPTPDYPHGFALSLTDGILRCRYRDSFEKPRLMKKNKVYKVVIEPFDTANLFKRGHRLRLDIASSSFPKFDVNPQTGEPEGAARQKRVATNRVHVDARHPSILRVFLVHASKALSHDKAQRRSSS